MRNRPLLFILTAAGVLRLVYFLVVWYNHPESFWAYDSGEYWRLAENLLNHGEYSRSNGAPFIPNDIRTPLYPLLLTLIMAAGGGLYAVVLVQLLMSVSLVFVVYLIAKYFARSEKAGVIAAAIMATDIPSVVFANYVLTETLFTLLLASSVLFLVRYYRSGNQKRDIIASALLLGLSMLCRPLSLYLVIPVVIALALDSGLAVKRRILNAFIFSGIVLLTISPWLYRNVKTFDRLFFSTTTDFMLAAWNAPNIVAQKQNISTAQARYDLWSKWYYESPYDAYAEPVQYAGYIREKSIEIIRSEPGLAAKQHVKGVFHLLAKPARGQILHQLAGEDGYDPATLFESGDASVSLRAIDKSDTWLMMLMVLQILLLLITYAGCILAVPWLWRNRNDAAVWLVVLFVFLLINAVVPPVTYSRFRVPVMPLLAVISGLGWVRWRNVKVSQSPDQHHMPVS